MGTINRTDPASDPGSAVVVVPVPFRDDDRQYRKRRRRKKRGGRGEGYPANADDEDSDRDDVNININDDDVWEADVDEVWYSGRTSEESEAACARVTCYDVEYNADSPPPSSRRPRR